MITLIKQKFWEKKHILFFLFSNSFYLSVQETFFYFDISIIYAFYIHKIQNHEWN